jgi:hypothetical protein
MKRVTGFSSPRVLPPNSPLRGVAWFGRLYVPLSTLALVLVLGDVLASRASRVESSSVDERALAIEACAAPGDGARWVYLGNSQISSMPGRLPGDLYVPGALEARLRGALGVVTVCPISLGGMNLAESFALLAVITERLPEARPVVVTSVALDQMRSVGLRDEVAREIEAPQVKSPVRAFVEAAADLTEARRALAPFLQVARPGAPSAPGRAGPAARVEPSSAAERAEAALQAGAERLPLFARREDIQRSLVIGYVTGRNRLLGISSASIRPLPESTYRQSLQLLELSIRYADARRVRLVVYIAPFRPRQPRPFPEATLVALRRDVKELCARYRATCLDYVDLLPDEVYSVYPPGSEGLDGQPDFAHLTARGHEALAAQLFSDLGYQAFLGQVNAP